MQKILSFLFLLYIISTVFICIVTLKNSNALTGFSFRSILVVLVALFLTIVLPIIVSLIVGAIARGITGSEIFGVILFYLVLIGYTVGMLDHVLTNMVGVSADAGIKDIFNSIWNYISN